MTRKLSPWYPPEIKPVHEGEYQRRSQSGMPLTNGIWADSCWLVRGKVMWKSVFQNCYWRGLARKP